MWECAHVGKHCAHVGHAVVATSIAVKIAHPFIRHTCAFKIVIAAVLSEPKSLAMMESAITNSPNDTNPNQNAITVAISEASSDGSLGEDLRETEDSDFV